MSSLVEELQGHALDQQVTIIELLQKCLVVATKLGQSEFASWARTELDGYKDKEVPEYRIVYGEAQVFNPYQGFRPIHFNNPEHAERFSTMHFNQPIGEIEHNLKRAGSDDLGVSYSPKVEKMLMDAMNVPFQPSLHVNASQFRKIVDAVRKIVLEWSLKLETDGILGTGMSFSREEKQKAQSVTYHIKNYIHGNVDHSQIQVESTLSSQNATSELDLEKLKELLNAIRSSADEIGLDNGTKAELISEIATLDAQTQSPKPKKSILRESLGSIQRILEGASGNLVASGLLSEMGKILGL